jgi:hypothetical protein
MKRQLIAFTLATAFFMTAGEATAENVYGSSIQVYNSPKTHDAKIEAAAIQKVAGKIGDLRGSLEGMESRFLTNEETLKQDHSSHLGFPVIQDQQNEDMITTGSVLKVI